MMLDRLLRWLRIRRAPVWYRVTARMDNSVSESDCASYVEALWLAAHLTDEGFSVSVDEVSA